MSGLRDLGRVRQVQLFIEDHGVLTLFLHFDFGGSGQGFGGYALDTYDKEKKRRVGCAAGTDFILRLLNLFKVSSLKGIVGRTAYALRNKPHDSIVGIEIPSFDGGGKFLIEDWSKEWFG